MLHRRAARVVLVDRRDRVLLFRGGDPARPSDGTWWFTAGGGAEAGETLAAAAVREVAEETGLDIAGRVGAAVLTRPARFVLDGTTVAQDETFFVVRVDVDGDEVQPDHSGWTDLERRTMTEQRWWTRADLATTTDTVYPDGLAELLAELPVDLPVDLPGAR